jgi:hypothetical protein
VLRAFNIQADTIARLARIDAADRPAMRFPPLDCEVSRGYEYANHGSVMDVLLQFLEASGVIPRTISATPCPEDWKEFGGPSCVEEAILTSQEAKEVLGCLAGYQLEEERFRHYWCRYINGHFADSEPSPQEREAIKVAYKHLDYFTELLRRASTAEWLVLGDYAAEPVAAADGGGR